MFAARPHNTNTWLNQQIIGSQFNKSAEDITICLIQSINLCLTLSNPVPWQNCMAAYFNYTLQIKTLFRGWPVMAHETHTRRRRINQSVNQSINGLFIVLDLCFTGPRNAVLAHFNSTLILQLTNKEYLRCSRQRKPAWRYAGNWI